MLREIEKGFQETYPEFKSNARRMEIFKRKN